MAVELHISVSDHSHAALVVHQLAEAQKISPDQAATQLLIEGADHHSQRTLVENPSDLNEAIARVRAQHPTYASLFGSVKGPGAHGSKASVDRYIAELRDEW